MAKVGEEQRLRTQIDDYLAYLLRQWRSVPGIVAEWNTWSELQQLDFDLEWGIVRDRLSMLRQWADQNHLTPQQRQRYAELQRLIAEHTPLLATLLDSPPALLDP